MSKSSSNELNLISPGYTLLIWYTILGAGGFGLSIFFPNLFLAILHPEWAAHISDYPVWYQCLASHEIASALASILALQQPLRLSPIYVCQFIYKSLWLTTTIVPKALMGELYALDALLGLVMASYVVMDILFLPWEYILEGSILDTKKEKKKE